MALEHPLHPSTLHPLEHLSSTKGIVVVVSQRYVDTQYWWKWFWGNRGILYVLYALPLGTDDCLYVHLSSRLLLHPVLL